jgi:hypothetical protein
MFSSDKSFPLFYTFMLNYLPSNCLTKYLSDLPKTFQFIRRDIDGDLSDSLALDRSAPPLALRRRPEYNAGSE